MDITHTPDRQGDVLNNGLLRRAAHRAERHWFLMGHALAEYRRQQRMDDAALADWLGCTVQRLYGLALCRRPLPGAAHSQADVEALAGYIRCDPGRLSALLQATADAATVIHLPPRPAARR